MTTPKFKIQKQLSKFKSPLLKSKQSSGSVSQKSELTRLESENRELIQYSIQTSKKQESIKDLIDKWTIVCKQLIAELRSLIGQVPVNDSFRILSLKEVAASLKFDINALGNYDECNDEFV